VSHFKFDLDTTMYFRKEDSVMVVFTLHLIWYVFQMH